MTLNHTLGEPSPRRAQAPTRALLGTGALVLLLACSSTSGSGSVHDAGAADDAASAADDSTDAAARDAGGDPASTAEASTDGATPGDAAPSGSPSICAPFEAHVAQCGFSTQCQSEFAQQCPSTVGAHASAALAAAWGSCSASVPCNDGDPADDACLFSKVVAVPPTAVQGKLARDFCAACAQGAATTTDNGISCAGNVVSLPQGSRSRDGRRGSRAERRRSAGGRGMH
jgi:hypothetical protein